MKEDVLEQLVDDYLMSEGFFTVHNVKFGPLPGEEGFHKNKDNQQSDIDVLGFHPLRSAPDNVWVVSCKSWQSGFDVDSKIRSLRGGGIKKVNGKEAWKRFRELVKPKWKRALVRTVTDLTGTSKFTHITAVTKVIGDPSKWETNKDFLKGLEGCRLRILSLTQMLDTLHSKLRTTPASSEIGRLLQLIKASSWSLSK